MGYRDQRWAPSMAMDAFEESKHPREHGKFISAAHEEAHNHLVKAGHEHLGEGNYKHPISGVTTKILASGEYTNEQPGIVGRLVNPPGSLMSQTIAELLAVKAKPWKFQRARRGKRSSSVL